MNVINLKTVRNIRDFGGIVNKEGRRIKEHCFIRSAALDSLSKDELKKLTDTYRLKTVIDLRTNLEKEEKPDAINDDINYYHLPPVDELIAGLTHENAADKKAILDNIPDMPELYRKVANNETAVSQMKKVFEVIVNAKDGEAVLWHCSEGKDRCGITSALLLSLLDVDRETIFEDYLYTNKVAHKRATKMAALVFLVTRDRIKTKQVWYAFAADRSFLEAAFDEMEKRNGSVEKFLEESLGITKEMKENFKNRFLE